MIRLKVVLFAVLSLLAGATAVLAVDFTIELVAKVVGPSEVEVEVTSNIPGTIDVILGLDLAGQKPDDVFIGTDKRITLRIGRATAMIGKSGLPGGRYEVKASFYPRWGPQDNAAKAAGIESEIHARRTVMLTGTGESARSAQQRANNQRWVMENVHFGSRWDRSYWVRRFGNPQTLATTLWNPKIIKAYYFETLDLTIFVNELKSEVSHWRTGRVTE